MFEPLATYKKWNVLFKEVTDGPLTVWQLPQEGVAYTIGVDTSTGLAEDYSVAQVITNSVPFEQVACFRAKWSVVDVAPMVVMLGHLYNKAQIIIETNYPGNAVQDAIIQQYMYPNNYQAEQRISETYNISTKFGFQTTQASKWMLIRELQQVIKESDIVVNCPDTLEELGNFVYAEESTKTGAASGFNDDCVVSLMLAVHAALLRPQRKVIEHKHQEHPDISKVNRLIAEFIQKIPARSKEYIRL